MPESTSAGGEESPGSPKQHEPTTSAREQQHGESHSSESRDLEREPLLPNRRFVDPDDPIVSPLNLKRIAVLRSVLIAVLAVNALVLFLVVVSDFISIPFFNRRGKSFLDFDLALLNILTGAVTLWCFTVPAYYERILGYISCALVFIDLVVLLSVPYLRGQSGGFGNILWLWTLLNIALNCFADWSVERGKAQQEIRYTGRVEKRRSVFELFVMLVKIFVKLFLLWVIWCISLSIWLEGFDSHEKPWGKLIPVNEGQFKVHLACYGDVHAPMAKNDEDDPSKAKQPILLVEGGQLTSSEVFQEWIQELYHMNKIERFCIWDRPGYAFSDSAPSPVSISIIVEYLSEALRAEKIEGPFSAVGFDEGGLYSRVFASRNLGQIHSLLLVDSWHEDLLKHFPFSGSNKKNESRKVFKNILELMDSWQGFKVWLRGVVSPLGIQKNIHWFFHPQRYSSKSRIFGRDMVYSPKYLRARLQEQVTASILSFNEVQNAALQSVPLAVISSDFMIKNSLNWGKWQRDLIKISDRSLEWVVAENSGHKIWESSKGRDQLQQLLLRLVSEKSNY
ncbi:hypothetical protein CJI97_001615 [Candidozyma auris]|nr:hypothetical protein CJI97_001615 [[Candida] auris]